MELKPIFDRVVIKPITQKEKKYGSLIVAAESTEEPTQGEVVAVGNGMLGDGKQVEMGKSGLLADTGTHNISIVSDSYRNELRTITVEQAKNTEVEILFRDIKPVIRLAAPEKTKIVFDETEYTAPVDPFTTTQGDHTVKFLIGDYEIVRTITVSDGRSYNIAVNIDVLINEVEE